MQFILYADLYTVTLLNSFISSNNFLVESLGFYIYKTMSSAHRVDFTSTFLIWMTFISLSCLIALVRTSITMLNRSGDSGHPCFVPDIRKKAFNLLLLSIMLAVGLAFIMLRFDSSLPNLLKVFIMKGY